MKFDRENECYAYFGLRNLLIDPEEITNQIGLQPTDSWREGEIHPKTRRAKTSNGWTLHSRLPKNFDLEEHVKDVLDQLDTKKKIVLPISQKYSGHLQLVGYFYQIYPGFSLERNETTRIGEYELSLDFDFYYLYSERRDGTE
jgi:hypothetical protein